MAKSNELEIKRLVKEQAQARNEAIKLRNETRTKSTNADYTDSCYYLESTDSIDMYSSRKEFQNKKN